MVLIVMGIFKIVVVDGFMQFSAEKLRNESFLVGALLAAHGCYSTFFHPDHAVLLRSDVKFAELGDQCENAADEARSCK